MIGALAAPDDWGSTASVEVDGAGLVVTSGAGERLTLAYDSDFLLTQL